MMMISQLLPPLYYSGYILFSILSDDFLKVIGKVVVAGSNALVVLLAGLIWGSTQDW